MKKNEPKRAVRKPNRPKGDSIITAQPTTTWAQPLTISLKNTSVYMLSMMFEGGWGLPHSLSNIMVNIYTDYHQLLIQLINRQYSSGRRKIYLMILHTQEHACLLPIELLYLVFLLPDIYYRQELRGM